MKKLTPVFVGLLTVASFACSEQGLTPSSPVAPGSLEATEAKGGGKPPADFPVTTTIQGVAGDFDIASDGLGSYTQADASSVMQGVGAWVLDLNVSGGTRTVHLDFDNFDPPGSEISLSGDYKARLIAQCNRAPYNESMLAMSLNDTIQCPLYVRFDAPSGSYRITMNPNESAGLGSNDVNITCTAPATGPCSAWQIAPNGVGVGVLDKQGRGTKWDRQGTFNFAFSFNVTMP